MPRPKKVVSKVLPRASDNKTAAQVKRDAEAARKLRIAEALAERTRLLAAEETAQTEASLKVTEHANKTRNAERRAQAALRRAENTEALLQQERERIADLEQQLASAGQPGKFEANRAEFAATGSPGHGRPEGKVAKTARANLYGAFDKMGGVEALVRWGQSQPTEFYRIWARLVPIEVDEESKTLPLETLLDMLSQRADQTVEQAAREIGKEVLDKAREDVDLEAAASLFEETQK